MSTESAEHCCREMKLHLDAGEVAIKYTPRYREYAIRNFVCDELVQIILFCPWCGRRLPRSLRDEWFERVHGGHEASLDA